MTTFSLWKALGVMQRACITEGHLDRRVGSPIDFRIYVNTQSELERPPECLERVPACSLPEQISALAEWIGPLHAERAVQIPMACASGLAPADFDPPVAYWAHDEVLGAVGDRRSTGISGST
jgi:hypothetical protein